MAAEAPRGLQVLCFGWRSLRPKHPYGEWINGHRVALFVALLFEVQAAPLSNPRDS